MNNMNPTSVVSRQVVLKGAMLVVTVLAAITFTSVRLRADTRSCGGQMVTVPFTDVMGSAFFCQIAEAYFSGLMNGTSATRFSPANKVTGEEMAAFATRTLDQGLRRGSRRAALGQWATPSSVPSTGKTIVGQEPKGVASDGADIWVANSGPQSTVSQVQASNGKLIGTWTGVESAANILIARGRVFVAGRSSSLYVIDPQQPPGPAATLTNTLPTIITSITFDGSHIWTASPAASKISKIDPDSGAHTDFSGFSEPLGIIFDGTYLWVTDDENKISKVDRNGQVLLSLPTGRTPGFPVYDGINIWVPNLNSSTVTVIRVSDSQGNPLASPFVLATLADNGLARPIAVAFDGQRILAINVNGASVSLWRASDLSPLGSFGGALQPQGVCSDGINFWITSNLESSLLRF